MAKKRNEEYYEREYNSRRPLRRDNFDRKEKPRFSISGLLGAILIGVGGFYMFTVIMPKIGGKEFDVEQTMSIVELAKEKTSTESESLEENIEELENNTPNSVEKNSDFGTAKALTDGKAVLSTGETAAKGFWEKIKEKFFVSNKSSEKPKEPSNVTIQKIEEKSGEEVKKTKEQRVFLDEKLQKKSVKNEKGELVNDLSYYE